jgi:hypothetical protein
MFNKAVPESTGCLANILYFAINIFGFSAGARRTYVILSTSVARWRFSQPDFGISSGFESRLAGKKFSICKKQLFLAFFGQFFYQLIKSNFVQNIFKEEKCFDQAAPKIRPNLLKQNTPRGEKTAYKPSGGLWQIFTLDLAD